MKITFNSILYLFSLLFIVPSFAAEENSATKERLQAAAQLMDLEFTDAELELMLKSGFWEESMYRSLRGHSLPNDVPPALVFNPLPQGFVLDTGQKPVRFSLPQKTTLPENRDDLAFYSVRDLAHLIQSRLITSTELTQFYLERLKKYGPPLHCVVTLTEELALKQAAQADKEIAQGNYRGLLHGIPYGVKDLFAVPGYKTTWGAAPYKDQVIDKTATVIKKLEEAGAVLVAKLSLGSLAMGDVWYEDTTRNPWKIEQGSSGSSAGSAAATAAGLVAFSLGTETHGSIVSPSIRCGVTGLRPTFGRVSRAGAMALTWSMDKIGPICRTVEDCAIVLHAIHGTDGMDPSVMDAAFNYESGLDLSGLRIGYLKSKMEEEYSNKKYDQQTLEVLKKLGVDLQPVEFPDMDVDPLFIILWAESATAFDELTRSGQDDLLTRQGPYDWPNNFRKSRFIPAVEYIQANRIRKRLMEDIQQIMKDYDTIVTPSFHGNSMLISNLTGHPTMALPNGFKEDGTPTGITFMGQLFGEAKLMAVAKRYQEATDFHLKHPQLEDSVSRH